MEVDDEDNKKDQDTSTPIFDRSTRCLPLCVVGGHNNWEKIVKMMKEERIKFHKANTTRDGT